MTLPRFHLFEFEDQPWLPDIVRDLATDERYTIAAQYLIAADGGRTFGPALGTEMAGPTEMLDMVSTHFSADLSEYWDDEPLITANPLLRSLSGLAEIWSGARTADYFPLTNTIFWIEYHLFGVHAAGYHALNIFLQSANALLVWAVLRRLEIPGAWLAGAMRIVTGVLTV